MELYAILEAFRTWRRYIGGTKEPVHVFSDHKNLYTPLNSTKLTPWLVR